MRRVCQLQSLNTAASNNSHTFFVHSACRTGGLPAARRRRQQHLDHPERRCEQSAIQVDLNASANTMLCPFSSPTHLILPIHTPSVLDGRDRAAKVGDAVGGEDRGGESVGGRQVCGHGRQDWRHGDRVGPQGVEQDQGIGPQGAGGVGAACRPGIHADWRRLCACRSVASGQGTSRGSLAPETGNCQRRRARHQAWQELGGSLDLLIDCPLCAFLLTADSLLLSLHPHTYR